ncbi:MAG: hypothetical protein H7A23_04110 [Leptospiraceae bacterium]|nr:hypothetical protein [Leptospiraceae bacterium]MCP5493716.1 hypothetical protein [Leptospiraceae bacterium]
MEREGHAIYCGMLALSYLASQSPLQTVQSKANHENEINLFLPLCAKYYQENEKCKKESEYMSTLKGW